VLNKELSKTLSEREGAAKTADQVNEEERKRQQQIYDNELRKLIESIYSQAITM
jgi:hypothetical protein